MAADHALASLQAASCTYRIALGPRAGQKVLRLRTLPGRDEKTAAALCAEVHGFSLPCRGALWRASAQGARTAVPLHHAPGDRQRTARAHGAGDVVLQLKSAWRDGTTHIKISPLEFMQRLAALVPRPRLHLIRFHGVLAPHAGLRATIVPDPPHKSGEDAATHARLSAGAHELGAVAQARVRYRPRTLPAVWRRVQDHRRHRRARSDRQDPHASGLTCARAAMLTGAAAGAFPGCLISQGKTVLQRADDPARPTFARSYQSASDARRFEDQIVIAKGEFSVTIARFTAFRTDYYGHSQSKRRLIFLSAIRYPPARVLDDRYSRSISPDINELPWSHPIGARVNAHACAAGMLRQRARHLKVPHRADDGAGTCAGTCAGVQSCPSRPAVGGRVVCSGCISGICHGRQN